jgi:hypothetical protein
MNQKQGERMRSKLLRMAVVTTLTACSSGPNVKVVEQSDSKPSWASITRTTYQDGDKMKFVGYFTADGSDARPSAAIHGAGTKATAMPLQSISDDFLQQSGVAEDMHDSSAKLVISTLRKNPPTIPGLQVTGNYYERVEIQGSDGSVHSEIRAYSLAECPIGEYNQAKHEALSRLKGNSKLTQELDNIMAEQHDRVYGVRTPATSQDKKSSTPIQAQPVTPTSSNQDFEKN